MLSPPSHACMLRPLFVSGGGHGPAAAASAGLGPVLLGVRGLAPPLEGLKDWLPLPLAVGVEGRLHKQPQEETSGGERRSVRQRGKRREDLDAERCIEPMMSTTWCILLSI